MAKFLNSWLLAGVAFIIVAAGSFFIVSAALNDGDAGDDESMSPATTGEQRVIFVNLGMT